MKIDRRRVLSLVVLAVFSSLATAHLASAQAPCEVPDNGSGTVDLPPAGCGYVSPNDLHMMIAGLPAGTQINVSAEHAEFFNISSSPGGLLGGERETFDSIIIMNMSGTGLLGGFTRNIAMPLSAITDTAPRTPGDPVQTFNNDMFGLQGELFGDPDFDVLRIEAGTAFGLPSPGQTTLTELSTGNFNVDSFFDVEYRITFQGAPGSILEGFGGITTDTVRMQAGVPAPGIPPCIVEDNGTGTVDLPPPGCGYVSPDEFHVMLNDLPPGTEINIAPEHKRFIQVVTTPGGSLGGEVETFNSDIELRMTGTGALAGFSRTILMPLAAETHTGPRTPGASVQSFDTDMFRLDGAIFGDPDFDQLIIQAGTGNGLPSPGHTTLTRLEGTGQFNVDSFFDVEYRISFTGAPGGQLEGLSGTTQGSVNMQAGGPACPPIPAGDDVFPSTAKLVVQLNDGSDPFVVRLSSADLLDTIVHREPQVGRTIDVEIVQLDLSGFHPRVGPIQVSLSPAQPSTGQITEILQDPTTCELISADSFFDVVVDINLPALGEAWSCDRPIRLQSELFRLPPENVKYENPFLDPINLISQADGGLRGQLLYHLHHVDPPIPPPGPDCIETFIELGVNIPPFGFLPLQAQGPTTVERGPAQVTGSCDISGTSCTEDADCPLGEICIRTQNQADAVLSEMQLEGFDSFLGGFQVRVNPNAPPSGGLFSSQNPGHGTFAVDSFFDVFVEIELSDQGATLHNNDPVPIQAGPNGPSVGVRNIPPDPGTPFQKQTPDPVPLFTEDNQFIGEILTVNHTIDIPRDWQPPPPNDDYCFDSWVHLEIELFTPACTDLAWLHGHFRIMRDDPVDSTGDTILDLTSTLMAKALFEGNSDCVGQLTARLKSDETSGGSVSRLTPEEFFPADSFFDVYIEIDSGIGLLHTQDPSHMTTTINNLPPDDGEIYFGPGTTIPLYQGLCFPTGESCKTDADCPDTSFCNVTQIGEIREISHRVHRLVECPSECDSFLLFDRSYTDPTSKGHISVGIPGGGLGVVYDVVRGTLNRLRQEDGTGFGFSDAILIQTNGPQLLNVPGIPFPGDGFYYISRDGFGNFNGTWNSGSSGQVGNRDPFLP